MNIKVLLRGMISHASFIVLICVKEPLGLFVDGFAVQWWLAMTMGSTSNFMRKMRFYTLHWIHG